MNTKSVIAGLLVLGVVAAGAAALLVASLKVQGGRQANGDTPPKTRIVVATEETPAMTVIEGQHLETREVPLAEAEKDYMADSSQVIGKVLAVPVKKGQVFRKDHFVTEGSGPQMAAALTDGMRAVSVTFSDPAANSGLLYPGCVVDVLLSIAVGEEDMEDERVSVPLLQRVQVLAVGRRTVFSGEEMTEPPSERRVNPPVTLIVEPDQARALQLARQYGSLSLAIRNPFDEQDIQKQPLMISDLVERFPFLDIAEAIAQEEATEEVQQGKAEPAATEAPPAQWRVMVIRGSEVEKKSFPMDERGAPEGPEPAGVQEIGSPAGAGL